MLQIKINVLGALPAKIIWFASKPSIWNCFNCYYKQSTYTGKATGYIRENFFTKVIDLRAAVSELEADFDPKTSYEIRRAVKDGVTTGIETDFECFINFYNSFSATKNLPMLSTNFKKYHSDTVITRAVYNNKTIVMHAYLKDDILKKVRLLHSASLFRIEPDPQIRAVAGRANRLLHYRDICYFKTEGYETYDLGGYAPDTTDDSLLRINQFKDSFGGVLKKESDYLPLSASLFSLLNKLNRLWH